VRLLTKGNREQSLAEIDRRLVAVVRGGLITTGLVEKEASSSTWTNSWFVAGVLATFLAVLFRWCALTLYIAHRLAEDTSCRDPSLHLKANLWILHAEYGAHSSWLDVTNELRAQQRDDRFETTASNALFGDPAVSLLKLLKVDYLPWGRRHERAFNQSQTVSLPTREDSEV
jgi:hypothetical protein